jgi:hypothetical protein
MVPAGSNVHGYEVRGRSPTLLVRSARGFRMVNCFAAALEEGLPRPTSRFAEVQMASEPGHNLGPTALVHEAHLRQA